MKYESPTLSLMGQMEELTGSCGVEWPNADCTSRCKTVQTTYNADGTVSVSTCIAIAPC